MGLRSRTSGSVFVVEDSELARLHSLFSDVTEKPRTKHPSSLLGKYLGERTKIPLLACGYSSTARLLSSIRRFQQTAESNGNIFFLGVNGSILGELRRMAGEKVIHKEHRKKAPAIGRTESSGAGGRAVLDRLFDPQKDQVLAADYWGTSAKARLVRALVIRAAACKSPVLILGQNGTGKEIVARLIHTESRGKCGGKFVAMNCAAIPAELFESELFGSMKGAFTNAHENRRGAWQMADGGTLFLDEVGDLAPEHQAKILRALQENRIRPVGSEVDVPVDARIVAATNRDLAALIESGRFREDLYYRLAHFLIRTPSLREVEEDFDYLAQHVWEDTCGDGRQRLPGDVIKLLRAQPWPGNVRQLSALLARVFNLFGKENPTRADFEMALQMDCINHPSAPKTSRMAIRVHQFECMQHLRWTAEVVRGCEVLLEDICGGKMLNGDGSELLDAFDSRIGHLSTLTLKPLLFNQSSVFDEVSALSAKLDQLAREVRTDSRAGCERWRVDMKRRCRRTLKALFSAISKLEDGTVQRGESQPESVS